MRVITSNPVKFSSTLSNQSMYQLFDASNFDAKKASPKQITAFQKWVNTKGLTDARYLPKLIEDGIVTPGKNTEKAIAKHGAEFDQVALMLMNTMSGGSTPNTTPTLPVTATGTPATNANLTTTSPTGEKKAGYVFDKTLGAFVKLKDAGVLDMLGNLFGKNLGGGNQNQGNQQTWDGGGQTPPPPPTTDEKPGMSKTTKILIGVGGALVLGVIIYMLTKKSGSVPAKV